MPADRLPAERELGDARHLALSADRRQRRVVDFADLRELTDEELVAFLVRQLGVRRARHVGQLLKPQPPRRRARPKTTEQRLKFLTQQVQSLASDVALDDPEDLRSFIAFAELVDRQLRAAGRAQGERLGWPDVGAALGTSRQGARQRFTR